MRKLHISLVHDTTRRSQAIFENGDYHSSIGEQSVLACDIVSHNKLLPIVFKGCSAF
jgi:hypothetical protein